MTRNGRPPSRRAFVGFAGAVAGTALTVGLTGCTQRSDPHPPAVSASPGSVTPVQPTGDHQAGIVTPTPAQPHLLLAVFDVTASGPSLAAGLAALGDTVRALVEGRDPRLAGLSPGDLSVTVGVGPRLVRAAGRALPGSEDLPVFGHELIADANRGGDLMLQICASDPLLLPLACAALSTQSFLRPRWQQDADRGPYVSINRTLQAPHNLLGFVDGIVGPTVPEYDGQLWLAGPRAVAGGTIAVVRRMEIDVNRFLAQPVAAQQAVFGRDRGTSAPLSGGTADTAPDLGAKTPDGRYLIPADAHVRRAHALATGVPKMLRRSYSMTRPTGLLFISFQNALRTFTATLNRMHTMDALLDYTTTTATGTFLVLPGFSSGHPLGSSLFGA